MDFWNNNQFSEFIKNNIKNEPTNQVNDSFLDASLYNSLGFGGGNNNQAVDQDRAIQTRKPFIDQLANNYDNKNSSVGSYNSKEINPTPSNNQNAEKQPMNLVNKDEEFLNKLKQVPMLGL